MQHPMAETDGAPTPGTRPVRPPMGQGRIHARKIGGVGRPSVQMKYAKNTAQAKPTPLSTPAFYHVVSESTTETPFDAGFFQAQSLLYKYALFRVIR